MNMHMLTAIQNVKNLPKHVMREELGSGTSFIGVLILSERRRWPTSKLENVPASRTATMVVKLGLYHAACNASISAGRLSFSMSDAAGPSLAGQRLAEPEVIVSAKLPPFYRFRKGPSHDDHLGLYDSSPRLEECRQESEPCPHSPSRPFAATAAVPK